MIDFIRWYFAITVLGLLTFPLAYRVFPALADRGYSFSRALGLLLWGFIFWLSVSFGIVRNEIGGLLFTLTVLVILSIWAQWSADLTIDGDRTGGQFGRISAHWNELIEWYKANLRVVFSVEILFLLAFAAWAFVRANNPEITSAGGEKWMEVAFINAILRSPTFPPHDPWLSGFAISYYYFGYVLTAMLAMINGTVGSIAHNLMLSLIFAMSAIGAYGLLYNLLSAYWKKQNGSALLGAFLGPVFLLIMSNVEGFLELLHAYGIGWFGTANFWTWLNIKDLNVAPALSLDWAPRFWFWWRASRVVHDYDLLGNFIEVIDEFPFFSYLLGDLHPHVLAMPFGLLALALALNLYLDGWKGETNLFGIVIPVCKQGLLLAAVILGGLAFLNTWDFPVYLAVVAGAFTLSQVNQRSKPGSGVEYARAWSLVEDLLKFSLPLALTSIILYLPFYLSFSSQAGGILPNIFFPTRGVYLWIMFGTLFVPIFIFLYWLSGKQAQGLPKLSYWKIGFLTAIALTLGLWALSILLGIIAGQTDIGRSFITSQGLTSTQAVFSASTLRRLQYGGSLLTLILMIGVALSHLINIAPAKEFNSEQVLASGPIPLVAMFILFGGLLVLAPEFIYLRDQFGTRMNTVFKFYYQAWTLWSLAAAFAFVVVAVDLRDGSGSRRGLKLGLFMLTMAAILMIGFTYPALALPNKTENFNISNPEKRTLDGAAYLAVNNPDDYAAIQWLTQAKPGILVEAVGGSYTEFARVATYSGLPTVMGWPGHEGQWRGGSAEMEGRADAIALLYNTPSWAEAKTILDIYDIQYVYLGRLERTTYQVDEQKFAANLSVVYNQGQVVIYEYHAKNWK